MGGEAGDNDGDDDDDDDDDDWCVRGDNWLEAVGQRRVGAGHKTRHWCIAGCMSTLRTLGQGWDVDE